MSYTKLLDIKAQETAGWILTLKEIYRQNKI